MKLALFAEPLKLQLLPHGSFWSGNLRLPAVISVFALAFYASAGDLDVIGMTLLSQIDPTLNGSGIRLAQVETTDSDTSSFAFEVIPQNIGQPTNLFSYYSTDGMAGGYPNAVGSGSSHATSVAYNFYGTGSGMATNCTHVDNYDVADLYFYNDIISPNTAIAARVVNQSFNFSPSGQSAIETAYDNYVISHKTLFLTGAGNGGFIYTNPPGTAYNGLAVGVSDGPSAVGPTSDGRSKPDIIAPGSGATSFSTPYVSGAAALLLQAAIRGDGGATSSLATNPIVVKALLLNGAVKPVGWTNSNRQPLDARYGAGVLNVFNSWVQLKGSQHGPIESTTNSTGSAHPPGASTANEPSLIGWDYNTALSTSTTQQKINHYYFSLAGASSYTFTATVVWNRQASKTNVNNLDLFLYDMLNTNLVLCSTSLVDNVEHLFVPRLAPGRYDLQVIKYGSASQVSKSETNALAFEIFSMQLDGSLSNTTLTLSWTNTPAGFSLASTTNPAAPGSWSTLSALPVMTNNQNVVSLPLTGACQFFRLQGP